MVCNLITQSIPRYPMEGGGYSSVEPDDTPVIRLYETTFANADIGVLDDESISIDGQGFYFFANSPGEGITSIVAGGTSGKQLRAQFFSGDERYAGIITTTPIPGAGKVLHVAIDLLFDGYSNFDSAIKKIFRFLSNGSNGDDRVCTLNAQEGVWRIDGDDAGGGIFDQTEGSATLYGPNTFIDNRRRLEFMMDITDLDAPECKVWVDGVEVISATLPARVGIDPSWNLDGTYIMTTFNTPAATASDYIDRIIFDNKFIGI
jgi:hypothetical protein